MKEREEYNEIISKLEERMCPSLSIISKELIGVYKERQDLENAFNKSQIIIGNQSTEISQLKQDKQSLREDISEKIKLLSQNNDLISINIKNELLDILSKLDDKEDKQ